MLAEDPAAPALMGALIETGSRFGVFLDYALGAARMLIAAAVAARFSVAAEQRPLEDVAKPLASAD